MGDLQIFQYEQAQVRTAVIESEPWFVLSDLCHVLNLSNPSVVAGRLRDSQRSKFNLGRQGDVVIINESGLYRVLMRSNSPLAEPFQIWVEDVVLPTVRKTGRYELAPKSPAEMLLMAAQQLVDHERRLDLVETRISEITGDLAPKAEAFDHFLSAANDLTMMEAAKALGWGRNRLFEELRRRRILMAGSNLPYQRHLDAGHFRVREALITIGDRTETRPQTLVTPPGLEFVRRLLSDVSPAA